MKFYYLSKPHSVLSVTQYKEPKYYFKKKNLYYICWGEGTVFWYYFPKPGTPLYLRLQHSTSGILCLSTDATNLPYCCLALLQKQRESWALGR